jgi:tryptophan-rich sensory protein
MKQNYLIIPVITVLVALWYGLITSAGIAWYKTIKIPFWTPSSAFISAVWTIIFILSAISAIIVWNKSVRDQRFWIIILLFTMNALLNILWSNLFFGEGLIGWAAIEAIILDISVWVLAILIRPISKLASVLLLPYAGWVIFAIYLNCVIWTLNK